MFLESLSGRCKSVGRILRIRRLSDRRAGVAVRALEWFPPPNPCRAGARPVSRRRISIHLMKAHLDSSDPGVNGGAPFLI